MITTVNGATVAQPDLETLYQDIKVQGKVPASSREEIGAGTASFRDMYLDLGAIKSKLVAAGGRHTVVAVYADVLNIPEGLTWTIKGNALLLYARRLQIAGAARINLDFRGESNGRLAIFTDEVAGVLTVVGVAAADQAPAVFQIAAPPRRRGTEVRLVDDKVAMIDRLLAQGVGVSPPAIFTESMTTAFIYASVLFSREPAIAERIFAWVRDWSAVTSTLSDLFLRSASMATLLEAQIGARETSAAFVPSLSQDIYVSLASSYVAQAQGYENDYLAFSIINRIDDKAIALAQALLNNQVQQTKYADEVLKQSKKNHENAVASVNAAQKSFNDAKRKAELVEIDFREIGIPEWRRQKIVEAIIGLATAVITFGAGIAGMIAGNPGSGVASVQGAVAGAQAVATAAETGADLAKTATALAEVMEKLKEIIENLNSIYAQSQTLVSVADKVVDLSLVADSLTNLPKLTGGGDLAAIFEWEIYRINTDSTMKMPVEEGIQYAEELRLAANEIALYGQALTAAQVAAIKAGQEYVGTRLQKELAVAQQEQLQQYVASLKPDAVASDAMMQLLYRRYIEAKSSLFAALKNYQASYYYWALAESTVQAQIIDPVGTLNSGLTTMTAITLDRVNALNTFHPPPQPFSGVRLVLTEPQFLETLRTKRSATCTVSLDTLMLAGSDRVRLSTVRVWLEQARPDPATKLIRLVLKTAGRYRDRYRGTDFQFVSRPLERHFEYEVTQRIFPETKWQFEDGSFGTVTVDGKIDDVVQYAYVEPTPFADWQISVPAGSTVDLSGVTKVTLEFHGSAIGR
jgi:hypothetical protein